MGKKIGSFILVVFLVGIVGGASVMYNYLSKNVETDRLSVSEDTGKQENVEEENSENDEQYSKAPDFTVYDSESKEYKLSEFEGKPVILNFWASWCGPCKSEMPDFEEAYKEYGENIHFLMVNLTDGYQETVNSAKRFIEDAGYTFPIYYDTKQNAARTYGVYSVPMTFFIDENGYIIAHGTGALDAKTLQTGIDYIYDAGSQ